MAFCAAATGDWEQVKKYIQKLDMTNKKLDASLVGPLGTIALYLFGVYHQGTGDLDTALKIYEDERLNLETYKVTNSSVSQVEKDFALLAALNTIWIHQDSHRQDMRRNTTLIEQVSSICRSHPNRDIQTAFNLVAATVKTDPPTPSIQIKGHLTAALAGAQATANTQFSAITLSVMCSRFFVSVVGGQAEKSAMAASQQTHRTGNPLWKSVAGNLLAQCLELNSKPAEAKQAMRMAQEFAQKALPGLDTK